MATNYPGALDSLTNPTVSSYEDDAGVIHDEQHANANDAIEAIEGELGTDPAGAQATVKARLASAEVAITGTVWPTTGWYYLGGLLTTDGLSSSRYTPGANSITFFPFWCPSTVTISALTCYVGASAAGNVRLGIYTSTTSASGEVPSALLVDAGTASTSTNGAKEVATSQQLTGQTWYWLAMVSDAAGEYSAVNVAAAAITNNLSIITQYCTQSFTYGALPSSPTSPSEGTQSAGRCYSAMWVKL